MTKATGRRARRARKTAGRNTRRARGTAGNRAARARRQAARRRGPGGQTARSRAARNRAGSQAKAAAGRGAALAAADRKLREDVLFLLRGRGAHVAFEKAVAEMPPALQGQKPPGLPYSSWQQLEHMRRCLRDILDYVRDPNYQEPRWPEDYWPDPAPPSADAWEQAVAACRADLQAFQDLAADPKTDLLARVPHDPKGPTILHEALLVADHNAYHLGQLIVLRRALGAWRE